MTDFPEPPQQPERTAVAVRLRLLAAFVAFGVGVVALIVAIMLVRGVLG